MEELNDLVYYGANTILGNLANSFTNQKPVGEFDTGYERVPGEEIFIEDTRPGATPKNNKTGYYNKAQAERGIIKAFTGGISPYELLSTILDEGTWASRLPYMKNAIGDIGVGTQIGKPSYFDYQPMAYHDFFSPVQHYIGDPLTEKLMLARGYEIPWGEGEARIPPNFDYTENLAISRMLEGSKKYPNNQALRLGNYQSNNINPQLASRRVALTNMLKNNKSIRNLVNMYRTGE